MLGLIVLKGLVDNVLSDYLWAWAVLLTSPSVATVGLSLTIPMAAASQLLLPSSWLVDARPPGGWDLGACACVVAGFVVLNYASQLSAERAARHACLRPLRVPLLPPPRDPPRGDRRDEPDDSEAEEGVRPPQQLTSEGER